MPLKNRSKELGEELRVVYGAALEDLLKTNNKIMILDADLGGASFFIRFKKTRPEHFIDVGICEANMFGVAAGLSMTGYTPFVHTMAAFVTRRALDQIYISCAYSKNTVNVYASDPGFCSGFDGGTHSCFEDMAVFRAIPNAIVCDPCDQVQLDWTVRTLANRNDGAIHYIRAYRKGVRPIYEPGTTFELGKAKILIPGSDVLLISSGYVLSDALDAAEALEKKGVSVQVVDPVTIKPFDEAQICECAQGKKLVCTFENHSEINGLGSAVADALAKNAIATPLLKVGIKDVFGQVGRIDLLQKEFGLTAEDLIQDIERASL